MASRGPGSPLLVTALPLVTAPDLVLLDIMMPDMSGWDVCRELRAKGLDIPVIMLTARGEEADRVQGPGAWIDKRSSLACRTVRPGAGGMRPPL